MCVGGDGSGSGLIELGQMQAAATDFVRSLAAELAGADPALLSPLAAAVHAPFEAQVARCACAWHPVGKACRHLSLGELPNTLQAFRETGNHAYFGQA